MRKKIRLFIAALAAALTLSFVLVGCTQSVTSTVRYSTSLSAVGNEIVAYYSHGSIQTLLTVGNTEFTLQDIYEAAKTVEGDDYTYEQFLKDYVSVETPEDNSKAINRALLSSVKFYTEFKETAPIEINGVSTGRYENRTGLYTGSGVKLVDRNAQIELMKAGKIPPKTIPRNRFPYNPQGDWANACVEGRMPESNFSYAAPFTELALLSMISCIHPNVELFYDAEQMSFKNYPDADKFTRSLYDYRKEFLPSAIKI